MELGESNCHRRDLVAPGRHRARSAQVVGWPGVPPVSEGFARFASFRVLIRRRSTPERWPLTVRNADRGGFARLTLCRWFAGRGRCSTGSAASPRPRATTRRRVSAIGDANVLFWKPQVALFVNEVTLLPVLMPFAPASTLLDRFPEVLHAHLQAHSVPRDVVEAELAEMNEVRIAKTASRSVLGVMNEFTFLAEVHAEHDADVDLLELSLRGRSTASRGSGILLPPSHHRYPWLAWALKDGEPRWLAVLGWQQRTPSIT